MADWKYIVFRCGDQEMPIIFPGELIHADVARSMAHVAEGLCIDRDLGPAELTSAGHISALQVISTMGTSEPVGTYYTVTDDGTAYINKHA